MGETCLHKLAVERYSAGEPAGKAAAGIEEHLRSCPSCSAYLEKLRKEREEFLRAHPFAEFLSAHAAPVRVGPWYRRFPDALSLPTMRPVLVPAVCLLLVAIVVVPFLAQRGAEQGSDIRYKGASVNGADALSYIYKRGGVVHTGSPDDLFRAGDQVQIFYSSSSDRNLALFSIDSRGAVSFYQPEGSGALCTVRSGVGPKLAYPASIELDSTKIAELVVAVFSDKTFDTNQIKKWATGFNTKGDMAALEKAVTSNPPVKKSSVLTLMLKK